MKKIISLAVVLMLSFGFCEAFAQEQPKKPGPSIAQWLKTLQRKLDLIVARKAIPVSTGVAGVRGAREDSQVKLYWKGKKSEEAVTEEEMAGFRQAMELAEKGEKEASIKKLEEFMKQFPDSALIPDARKTLDMVKAEPKPEEKKEETKQ